MMCRPPRSKNIACRNEVKGESAIERSDTCICLKVKFALLFHLNVTGFDTDVLVKDGVVTLKGTAGNPEHKSQSTEYIREIAGVREVNNLLSVASAKAEDDRIACTG
ncbi:MAG: BON domain-containing protein [Candidatus Wallbacteria bacterium]|nr:BON domain-containing protein [Candidatus Wallbacteria bacterium]